MEGKNICPIADASQRRLTGRLVSASDFPHILREEAAP
jgi:hypothetical protein